MNCTNDSLSFSLSEILDAAAIISNFCASLYDEQNPKLYSVLIRNESQSDGTFEFLSLYAMAPLQFATLMPI